jgi:hypothetical protein
MRFSSALALCAAPLALAGSIQDSLVGRTMGEQAAAPMPMESPKEAGKSSGGKNVEVVNVQQTSVTQVIVIWVNNGGGAATSTMEAAKSMAPPPASAATHSVCSNTIDLLKEIR